MSRAATCCCCNKYDGLCCSVASSRPGQQVRQQGLAAWAYNSVWHGAVVGPYVVPTWWQVSCGRSHQGRQWPGWVWVLTQTRPVARGLRVSACEGLGWLRVSACEGLGCRPVARGLRVSACEGLGCRHVARGLRVSACDAPCPGLLALDGCT